MKKIFISIGICVLFASCVSQKSAIQSINYNSNGSVVVVGTTALTLPTNEQADSVLQAITKNIISYKHVSDSANVHYYQWTITSPPIQLK